MVKQKQDNVGQAQGGQLGVEGQAPAQTDAFLNRRRQLLKLGAAGMPMVLTLRASAAEAVISQLRCVITLPGSLKILVDDTGAAWVGDASLETGKGKGKGRGRGRGRGRSKGSTGWTQSSIDDFKENAEFVFESGVVPADFRPDPCEEEEECQSDNDDDDDDDDLLAHLRDENGSYALNDFLAGGGDDDDDDCHGHDQGDDDDGHAIVDCGYTLYEYSSGTTIKPGDFTNGSGFNLTGDTGVFLALAVAHSEEEGLNSTFPGVSCVISVLNFIGQ